MKRGLIISLVSGVIILLFSRFLDQARADTPHLVINEIRYDVSTASGYSEWVEIYNPTNTVIYLEGYRLTDLENEFVFPVDSRIESKEYLVIAKSQAGFKNEYNLEASYQWLMSLADGGDEIILRDDSGNDLDAVVYENGSYLGLNSHPGVARPNSIERQPKGFDSDDCAVDFIEQANPSPYVGLPSKINLNANGIDYNSIDLSWNKNNELDFKQYHIFKSEDNLNWHLDSSIMDPDIIETTVLGLEPGKKYYFKVRIDNLEGGYCDSNIISITTKKNYSAAVIINELFPHPSNGTDNEFIELFNSSNEDIDISDWILDDVEGGSSPYTIPNKTIIKANSYIVFYKRETKIALNDDGDQARLFWPNGNLCSSSGYYIKAELDYSWSRKVDGNWIFSTTFTPADLNKFTTKQDDIKKIPIEPISQVKQKPKNSWVKVEGVVIATPGLFGIKVVYIQDISAGIKIYFAQALWPILSIGDRLIVYGKILTSSGEFQIRIYDPNDIVISGHDPPIKANRKNINEITNLMGSLIKVSGRVVKISGSSVYINDGTGELRLYFYSATGIKKLGLKKGDWIVAAGVLSKTRTGLRLLPRSKADLLIYKQRIEQNEESESILGQKILGAEKAYAASDYRSDYNPAQTTKNYLIFFGKVIIILGLFSLVSLIIFARIRERYAKNN